MSLITILIFFIGLMNFISFTAMFLDKQKARKRAFRIPESTLFMIAILGGSLGCIVGMYAFRHKTRHASFVWGMPAIFLLELILLIFVTVQCLHRYDALNSYLSSLFFIQ